MTTRWILATLHLLGLGIGLGAIAVRASALHGHLDDSGLKRVLRSDSAWGIAALLWISTGLVRAFGGFEKGTDYYLSSTAFRYKMSALAVILLLEIWPMITFIRWRIALSRGHPVDTRHVTLFSRISIVQAALVILMTFAATAMARGIAF